MLLIAGLVFGMRPICPQSVSVQRSAARPAWIGWILLVMLCVAAGAYVAQMLFLVFHAIESVAMATRFWDGSEWGVILRTSRAAPIAVLAGTALLIAGVCTARSLHDTSIASRDTLPRRPYVLVLLTLLAACCAGYLLLVVVPTLSVELAEGLRLALGPAEVAIIAIGFAGFSAGLAAVAVAGSSSDSADQLASPANGPNRDMPRRFGGMALVSLVLAISVIVGLHALTRFPLISVPSGWTESLYVKALGFARRWLQDLEEWVLVGAFTEINVLILVPCVVWLMIHIVALLGTSERTRPPALDRIARQPQLLRRFGFYSVILTALCLSALPVLTVTGQVVYGFLERASYGTSR